MNAKTDYKDYVLMLNYEQARAQQQPHSQRNERRAWYCRDLDSLLLATSPLLAEVHAFQKRDRGKRKAGRRLLAGKNHNSVTAVEALLNIYANDYGADWDYVLRDLLTNLRHWADANGKDFEAEARIAEDHYHAEK